MKYKLLLFTLLSCNVVHAQFINNTGIDITNSTTLVANGDWLNEGYIVNDGTIVISDIWTNNGVLADTSTGGFVLEFANLTTFTPGGNRFAFLEVNSPFGVGLAVDGELVLTDSLILENGIVNVVAVAGSPNSPILGVVPGTKVTAGPTAHVVGTMSAQGTGNFMFPLGINNDYVPLTLHKVNAQKITTSVNYAPSGYTAGPGLDSLINFPYAWIVTESVAADTAAYVEVSYPNTLPKGANPIIAREIPGSQFASMGARLIVDQSGIVTVRSYSRRLNGMFTVANGFPADLVTDSLALVSLYQQTNGDQWTDRTNWLNGNIGTWFGVTLNGQSITSLSLASNNLAGNVPDPLVDIQALETLDLSGNTLTSIPDFSANTEVEALNVSDNALTFASLEPNAAVPGIVYSNQAEIGEPVDSLVAVGTGYTFEVNAGGDNSQYVWKRNGITVEGAQDSIYTLPAINRGNMGEYIAEVTNPLLPGLTLTSAPHRAQAYASVSGQLWVDAATPATSGAMTLYRITNGAFEKTDPIGINADGTFSFEKIVLDDYQLLGFADTLVHESALPTYYTNTIFWEEADTIVLEENIGDLTIVSHVEPSPSSGVGIIDGTLEEDDGTGGRTSKEEKARRVKGAAVTARRVESAGRGKEEVLTLVAYVFTDENGEFKLPDLPTGNYRLNIQYPGYPMDETSFTTITIGDALESHVTVAATVQEGKINVKKVIITGTLNSENYSLEVYPNPASDVIRMKFATTQKGRMVSLFDLSGKSVKLVSAEEEDAQFSIHDLYQGLYIMQIVENGATVKTLKVAIE